MYTDNSACCRELHLMMSTISDVNACIGHVWTCSTLILAQATRYQQMNEALKCGTHCLSTSTADMCSTAAPTDGSTGSVPVNPSTTGNLLSKAAAAWPQCICSFPAAQYACQTALSAQLARPPTQCNTFNRGVSLLESSALSAH